MDTGAFNEMHDKLGFAGAGKRVLIGMAAILVLVAAVSAYVLCGAATASEFEVTAGEVEPSEEGEPSSASDSAKLYVHVSGAVESPGLYVLDEGARVGDAVDAAGGFTQDAATDSCNLARVLEDGEHVIVASAADDAGQNASETESAVQTGVTATGLVNINTATAAQLQTLPGIGSELAGRIVADRIANGSFKNVHDLTRVTGIGDKKLEAIVDLICV